VTRAIMLDLETMSTFSNAVVVSIGACEFDPRGNGIGNTFYCNVGLWNDQVAHGRHMHGDTIAWWLGADASSPGQPARDQLFTEMVSPTYALNKFAELFEDGPVDEVWGNGSDFDNIILGSLYTDYGIKRPWSYSTNRCFRTMKNLRLPNTFVKPVASGTHHNALDDAINQAWYLQAIYKALNL
jgi:hypothetical protein